jgi:threonine synthase
MDVYGCSACGKVFPMTGRNWICECGAPFALMAAPRFEVGSIQSKERTLWRYRSFLPIRSGDNIVSLGEGGTPLVPFGPDLSRVYLKLDFTNPTGSFKDRGATVLVSKLKELGVQEVLDDSSGNAGAALAAYCAHAGITCHIYTPASHSSGKMKQIASYGAHLVPVKGSRQDTARAALDAASKTYYASHAHNPLYIEGTKTAAFELWEQLGGRAPGMVVTPLGQGGMFLGIYKGFWELQQAGYLGSLPRLVGVQSAACAPLAAAFQQGMSEPLRVQEGTTIAEGIKISEPVRGKRILAAIRETGGACVIVSDQEIEQARVELGHHGFYVEPTSATVLAGFRKLGQEYSGVNEVVLVLTGSGLKSH